MDAMSQRITGLSSTEVSERIAAGLVNEVPPAPSRTIPEIIRANVFTRFNALIALLAAIVIAAGSPIDAMFSGVIVANIFIGIFQEVRAKRTLDRLALLNAPHAHLLRDGEVRDHPVNDIVLDDVIELRPGGQIVADCVLVDCDGLEIDESMLTGESDAVVKGTGDELLSGSFVVTGSGYARVTKVGKDAYAARLAEEARRFTLANSELRASIEQIVTWVSWALIPAAIGLVWSQMRSNDDIRAALVAMVAGLVGMVPEGLLLLTSVAFFVGVVRLARRRTLVQELPAVEILARVDVVCLDKTGTITEGTMVVDSVTALGGHDDELGSLALTAIAHSDPNPNATQQALIERFSEPLASGWERLDGVPFSSARKWSANRFEGQGWWVLGAAEMILDDAKLAGVSEQIEAASGNGLRILLLAHTDSPVSSDRALPGDIVAVALVSLIDKIRPDAAETLRYFADQGVTLKVISGDNPTTVGAVAERAGLEVDNHLVDARTLPDSDGTDDEFADLVEAGTVFGRVTPHQKRAMVTALQRRDHIVAMTGDGVNDVLALKDADCGIAMASGSEATRAVAQVVLLDSSFSGLPAVVAEGRRVINNLQRVASLYLTKTTYAVIFAFVTGIFAMDFPFLPRHLTLISSLCIGIPSFFLALAPNTARVQGNFLRRVGWDSVPMGILCAAATMAAFVIMRSTTGTTLEEQQTAATLTLAGCSLLVLVRNARPIRGWKLGLIATMGLGVVAAFTTPLGKEYFQLTLPAAESVWICLAIVGLTGLAMSIVHRVVDVDSRVLEHPGR
ncbi:MAG: HAD-IC family P-type ATPase [Microthrixaceae bacterium]|nr:HAD-IC family P-type ATPase [Microthrixaceae bacterium]HPB44230.1 HAD-IC family P-type ATPase [Microthrixaceae bacterium]